MKRLSAKWNWLHRNFVFLWPAIFITLSVIYSVKWASPTPLVAGLVAVGFVTGVTLLFYPVRKLLRLATIYFDEDKMYVHTRGKVFSYPLSDVVYINRVKGLVRHLYEIGTRDNKEHYFMVSAYDIFLGSPLAREHETIDKFMDVVDRSHGAAQK